MLSNGFINVVAIVASYLLTVLYIGPRIMLNRKPLEIKTLIRFYNAAMILVNIYLIKRALVLVDNGRSFFNCKGVEMDFERVDEIAIITELFLLSRLADFLDTIWFVLRKKHSHISFLHVFHHSYVPTVAYVASRWTPVVPNAMAFPFINSAIHVIMYSYYLLATIPQMRPHLWWKRYLTALQMTQFIVVLIYNIFGFFYFNQVCGKLQIASLVGSLISALIFLALFSSFYKKTYIRPNNNNNSTKHQTTSCSSSAAKEEQQQQQLRQQHQASCSKKTE